MNGNEWKWHHLFNSVIELACQSAKNSLQQTVYNEAQKNTETHAAGAEPGIDGN